MIVVQQLAFAYPGAKPSLVDVSLRISEGERVGLVGPNGAGKTTLLMCLAGALRSSQGSIRVDDLNPSILAERRQLPSRVGLVFQNPDDQLFHATVFDDVAFGPLNLGIALDEVRIRVAEALEQVGLSHRAEEIPLKLSGGEKRRAAIAGVLAMRPRALLLDEPTNSLDPRARREVVALLQSIGGTQLIATHDLECVRSLCTRVLVMDAGRIVAEGDPSEVFKNSAWMMEHGLI